MNIMNIIMPYRHPDSPDIWVFDDEARDLVREPFIGEANQLLDYADEQLGGKGKLVVFFRSDMGVDPVHQHYDSVSVEAQLIETDATGSTYSAEVSHDGAVHFMADNMWLCPALLKYFDKAPKRIHAAIVRRNSRHKSRK